MAVVGKNFAILESGRLRMSGFVTWLVWVFLHLMSLPQLQNRMRVQTEWFLAYYTGQRSSRLIPELPRPEHEASQLSKSSMMNAAYLPALAALAGSAIGGATLLEGGEGPAGVKMIVLVRHGELHR